MSKKLMTKRLRSAESEAGKIHFDGNQHTINEVYAKGVFNYLISFGDKLAQAT
jgi:hypothetical protein